MTEQEQQDLSSRAKAWTGAACAGNYGKQLQPAINVAIIAEDLLYLAQHPSTLVGPGRLLQEKLVKQRWVQEKPQLEFLLRLQGPGPLTYQLYTAETRHGTPVMVKWACTLETAKAKPVSKFR